MTDKKRKYPILVNLGYRQATYHIGRTRYIVSSCFEKADDTNNLRTRFERIIKTDATLLTENENCGKIESKESVPTVGEVTNADSQ